MSKAMLASALAWRSSLDKVNAAMVEAYWKIGQAISEACGGSDRAAYGQLTEQRVQRHKLA
jgi:hypothetical protein